MKASNAAATSGGTTRPPAKEELEAVYADMPENKPGDMLRWSVENMPERGQNTFTENPRYANTLYPEAQPGFYNRTAQKNYHPKEKSVYGEHTDEALDAISNILTAASLIPGVDTFADAAAIPVDLLRRDYTSAGLDAIGVIPFIGEAADTAKLARAGINIADAAHDAGKIADQADDIADVVKATDDVYPGVTKREKLLSQASNNKLKNAVSELYRPGAITGDGGTADAIRYELSRGTRLRGRSHIQKGEDWIRALKKLQKNETLSRLEEKMVQEMIDDLEKALRGE